MMQVTMVSAFTLILIQSFSNFVAPTIPAEENQSTWNSLMEVTDAPIFPAQYDVLLTENLGGNLNLKTILTKFGALLQDPSIGIHVVYANYLRSYKNSQQLSNSMAEINDAHRVANFRENLMLIAAHNLEAIMNEPDDYRMGINAFTDLNESEFVAHYTGHTIKNRTSSLNSEPTPADHSDHLTSTQSAPESKDWRSTGAVSSIKDQKNCGSCVSHATTAILESAYAIHTRRKRQSLSRQEILDCTNVTCDDGEDWKDVYPYMIKKGVTTDQIYPYVENKTFCKASGKPRTARATRWNFVSQAIGGEERMKEVGRRGPIAAGICISKYLQNHKKGVFTGPCEGEISHAIAIIGYGSEGGKDYWIIKNSWGTTWSDGGFGKIERGVNLCNISTDATQIYI